MYQQRIREIYEHLSPGYRRLADFILKDYQRAAFMTAAEVGRASDVDTTLVVRFAQRLGYPGFPELIGDIQEDVQRDLRAVYAPTEQDSSAVGVLWRNLTQDRNNIEYMLLHLDPAAVQEVVALIGRSERIFIAGEGNVIYIAEALTVRLVVQGIEAHTVPSEPAGQAGVAAILTPNDLVIGFGMTLMTPSIAAFLKVARKAGARTLGIVGTLTNPVASVAEHVLVAPTITSGLTPSWTSMSALAHALSQAVMAERGIVSTKWALRTDQLLQAYNDAWRAQVVSVRNSIADYNAAMTDAPA